MAFIEVYLPNGQTEHFDLVKSQMILGRSPKADIVIQNEIISRQHAKIVKASHGRWIIEDMGSRNKTYFEKKPIKSHLLNNGDELRLGSIKIVFHDPSGKSDEKIDKTVYLNDAGTLRSKNENLCPACKAEMQEGAIVCIKCGFDKKLGKRRKIIFESTMNASAISDDPAPKPTNLTPSLSPKEKLKTLFAKSSSSQSSSSAESSSSSTGLTEENKQILIDYILPIGFILIALIISFIRGSFANLVLSLISISIQSAFLLLAMAIASKIGEFGFGDFKTAILKVIGICAALVIAGLILPSSGSFVVGLLLLIVLLKLSFELDYFEMFMIIVSMAIVKGLLLMIIMSAIMSLMR